ncbi:MAG: WYL domain-containing protein [Acidobacteria bacterium]|nr:MAG: WYL domain-containing protein [Acidobacteriota bacterium]
MKALREWFGAPVRHDRDRGGYFYDRDPEQPAFELPGIWLTADELRALVTLETVLSGLRPGLLADCLRPLARRLEELAVARRIRVAEATRRIRVLEPASRPPGPHFGTVASALLDRRQVHIEYHGRYDDSRTARDVSPQRLVHYRGAWYLDAWCHLRKGLRSFAVERITAARLLEGRARELDDALLDRFYASAYGIFAGEPEAWAILEFAPRAARWVAEETWHPRQQGRRLDDGAWELRVPYARPHELAGDILRWVPDVIVREPPELRELVRARLDAGLRAFGGTGARGAASPSARRDASGSDPPAS